MGKFDLPRSEIEHLIGEWVLNLRNKQIYIAKRLDGLTYEELAELFDLSVQRVKAIVHEVDCILLQKIAENETST